MSSDHSFEYAVGTICADAKHFSVGEYIRVTLLFSKIADHFEQ